MLRMAKVPTKSHSVLPPLGIGGAEVFRKMAVWQGKVFFPKPEGAYSNRGGRGAKVFSYITDKYFLKGSCKSCILTINFPVIFLSSI